MALNGEGVTIKDRDWPVVERPLSGHFLRHPSYIKSLILIWDSAF